MKTTWRILSTVVLLGLFMGSCSLRGGVQPEPASVPVYPAAERMSQQDDSFTLTAEYLAHAGLSEVAGYYRTEPAKAGWETSAATSDTHFSYYYVSRRSKYTPEPGKASVAEGYTLDVWLHEEGQATIIKVQRTFHSPMPAS